MIKSLYNNTIRPYLPTIFRNRYVNGYKIKGRYKILDISAYTKDVRDSYEVPLLEAINSYISENDKVIIIGGGYGISSLEASKKVGKNGNVLTYEASKQQVNTMRKTLKNNQYNQNIVLIKGVVGTPKKIWGDSVNKLVSPIDLPPCNTLVLDCEGSEISILSNLEIAPNTIIVEAHKQFGSYPKDIKTILHSKGYTIIETKPDPESENIPVLIAKRKEVFNGDN